MYLFIYICMYVFIYSNNIYLFIEFIYPSMLFHHTQNPQFVWRKYLYDYFWQALFLFVARHCYERCCWDDKIFDTST